MKKEEEEEREGQGKCRRIEDVDVYYVLKAKIGRWGRG